MNTNLKPSSTEAMQSLDTAHHFHPFTNHQAMHAEGGVRVIVSADGCWITDSEGHRTLDGMAGLWCVNIGYGRRELADTARQQMLELPFYNTFFKSASVPTIELAARLSALLPDGFEKVFFNNSGSEANDTVWRLVRGYWHLVGKPEKQIIISRDNAYHGSTVAAASLGGMPFMHAQAGLPIPGVVHVRQPYLFGEDVGVDPAEFGLRAARAIEEKILELGAENVAAFIGEPVMGAGGVIIPPDTYWPEVNRICAKYDVLLVCDEVICGFGRTGNWFGWQTYGIKPDLVTMAKGLTSGYLPLSAVGMGERVGAAFMESGDEFAHGYTYSGHPVASAVALRNIEIMEEEQLVAKAGTKAAYFATALQRLEDHPLVGEVRSVGLMAAVEVVRNKPGRDRFDDKIGAATICRDRCIENGAIIRACGHTMVMSPPLIIDETEMDTLVSVLRSSLDETANEIGV